MTPVIIDANLLVLLIVGESGPGNIKKHKNTSAYTLTDFENVVRLLRPPRRLSVCAHVFAESSNLVRQTSEPLKSAVMGVLGEVARRVQERNVPTATGVSHSSFMRLGLTDAILLRLIETEGILLSDDLDLCLAAERTGHRVINFNHVRSGSLSLDDL